MPREPLEAIVLVGGQGTRLRPLTLSAPKPLLPTAGVPFLAHLLARAAAGGEIEIVALGRRETQNACGGDVRREKDSAIASEAGTLRGAA
jgi:NDP-sugar pyrophosphorylase family protein